VDKKQKRRQTSIEKPLFFVQDKSGAIVVIAMIVLMVLAILGAVVIRTITTDAYIAIYDRSSKQALYLADAGLQRTLAGLNNDTIIPPASVGDPAIQINGSLSTGTYGVSVDRLTAKTLNTVNKIRITSKGTVGTKGEKTIIAIVSEVASYQEIYDFAFFSRYNLRLSGNAQAYEGDLYCGEDITISNNPVVINGDVLTWGNATFSSNGSVQNGSVRAAGDASDVSAGRAGCINLGNSSPRIYNGNAIAQGTVTGDGTVDGDIIPNTDPQVHPPEYYETQYKVGTQDFTNYKTKAQTQSHYYNSDQMFRTGTYNGIYYINGDLDIQGEITGDATFVVSRNMDVSGNVTGNGCAYIVDGNISINGSFNVAGTFYSNGYVKLNGNCTIDGSVCCFGRQGTMGLGNLTVNYTAPNATDELKGPPHWIYTQASWKS
jgi:hypothetical protein